MARRSRIFYAYPATPPDLGETINSAIGKLKSTREIRSDNVRIRPWTDNGISGKVVITTITNQIDRSEVFACDLTYQNLNVTFELGYAIARFKRVFCTLNPNITDAQRKFKDNYATMFNLGYWPYANHEELAEGFLRETPWSDVKQTLLGTRHRGEMARAERPTLMYIKPPVDTDSVIKMQEQFNKTLFRDSIIVDDPKENPSQILDWYAEKLREADCVIVQFLSTDHADHEIHNLRASTIAGLAHGFGRPTLMLAHAPYRAPIDYEHLLQVHSTANRCASIGRKWLDEIAAGIGHRRPRRQPPADSVSRTFDIRSLFLGDSIAENEAAQLHDYFVETSTFLRAMDDQLTILVGRRGTGKTAILYAINSERLKSIRNHVTILKPVGYETHGLIRVLDETKGRSERGYLIESLWKYLIYSEIAANIARELREHPIYRQTTTDENAFLRYFDMYEDVLTRPFSQRMDTALEPLMGIGLIDSANEQRLKISEHLHSNLIGEIRRHLGLVLTGHQGLTLLIDGLDEPWVPGDHIGHLSELIAGLLGVAQSIPVDFARSNSRVRSVDAKMTVFLRSDIFSFIQHLIPEHDKLPIARVKWDDPAMLLRVLDERMLRDAPPGRRAQHVWSQLFPEEVAGVSSQEFLLRTVLPRPRDLIHFVKAAVSNAVNRGDMRISEHDFLLARDQYSDYAFKSILKEDDPSKGKLEETLYEFAGADRILEKSDIENRMSIAGVATDDFEFYINLLCDINFLGVETRVGFEYPSDEERRKMLRNIANVISSRNGHDEIFEINPAFYQVLQIE